MSFQAVADSGSGFDSVTLRYEIDGKADPNDTVIKDLGSDSAQVMVQNAFGNYADLSLTRQLTLTPGTHTLSVLVESESVATGQGVPDMEIERPVLGLTDHVTPGRLRASRSDGRTASEPDWA